MLSEAATDINQQPCGWDLMCQNVTFAYPKHAVLFSFCVWFECTARVTAAACTVMPTNLALQQWHSNSLAKSSCLPQTSPLLAHSAHTFYLGLYSKVQGSNHMQLCRINCIWIWISPKGKYRIWRLALNLPLHTTEGGGGPGEAASVWVITVQPRSRVLGLYQSCTKLGMKY